MLMRYIVNKRFENAGVNVGNWRKAGIGGQGGGLR